VRGSPPRCRSKAEATKADNGKTKRLDGNVSIKQDSLVRAKEKFKDAQEAVSENHARMREDLRFSNPADPQQWTDTARDFRKGRPCMTFDRTNQFIAQVVNDGRQNKPAIICVPVDSNGDPAVAEKLNGIIRHIEYTSRAGIACDTALEYAARVGLGWMRVVPEIIRPETNEQEIRIKRIHDPLSVLLEAGWTEPDGSDALCGFVETTMSNKAFERQYPKAKREAWDSGGWFSEETTRICEYFYIEEEKENRIVAEVDGERATLTEEEFWQVANRMGAKPNVIETFIAKKRKVMWQKMTGSEILEETEFPSQYLPIVPVIGYELWVEGKRYLCGMTRRLMDGQRAYNYERSAFIESVALQPKAPFMAAAEAIDGHEDEWKRLNQGNPAYLTYNSVDEGGNQIPMPQRQMPPAFPAAFANGGQIASEDMEASIGMHKANLGQQGNETSGKAIRARQQEGDTANFHYIDNLSRSIEQLGRIVVDMIPRIYDTPRQARIVGEDGEQSFVKVDPEMSQAVAKQGKKVVAINPNVGAYDVRVKAGPSYTTLRQESAEQIAQMIQAAPDLMPIIGDVWVRMQDWPEGEKIAQRLKSMLPPQIQQMEAEDGPEIPPEIMGQLQQLQQQNQQLQQALEAAAADADGTKQKMDTEIEKARMNAMASVEVANIRAEASRDVEELKGLVSILLQRMQPPPVLSQEVAGDLNDQ
jgi:hypothetical protein